MIQCKRLEQAKKAQREYREFVNAKPGPELEQVDRLIEYMVAQMGFNMVITEQMPNWLLGHMLAWANAEVKRTAALNRDDARKAAPTYSGWDGIVAAGGRLAIRFDGRVVDDITVINLLNKLGATLPKRRPAREGKAR